MVCWDPGVHFVMAGDMRCTHTIGLASGETFPKVGWVREVNGWTKGVKRGAIKGDLWY